MPVAVLSSLALKGVLDQLKADFERSLGARLELRFDATQAILAQRQAGLHADVLVLTQEAMQTLQTEGEAAHIVALGSSGVGVAVRAGAPKPDIGSVDALKRALVSARSVAHSKVGASGIYFVALLKRLGLEGRVKTHVVEKGPVGRVVAAGEAELGVQQLCELAPVPGIDIVGPLPAAVQKLTHFAAGIARDAVNPQGARAFLELLNGDAARAAMRKGEIQPA